MAFPWLALGYGLYLGGKYAYHRIADRSSAPPRPDDLKVPTTKQGTPVPLLYGRCLVRQPILAWAGNQLARDPDGISFALVEAPYLYMHDMMLVLGVPFRNGNSSIHSIQVGGMTLRDHATGDPETPVAPDSVLVEQMTGEPGDLIASGFFAGTYECAGLVGQGTEFQRLGGHAEFLDGRTTQTLVDGSLDPVCNAGLRMVEGGVPAWSIPGYRGWLSVFLWHRDVIIESVHYPMAWMIGIQPSSAPIAIECSTYLSGFAPNSRIGDDCNPVVVITDLLTGGLGKLGLPTSLIHASSFNAAEATLKEEGLGYSRCIDERREVSEIINEILEQIDAVLYEDFRDGLEGSIRIKLIRPDYALAQIPHITPANCEAIENFAVTSMSDAVNLVRVVFTDRDNNYAEGEATAMDGAIITASGEGPVEAVLHYPGCCTQEQAETLAGRELAARGQPIARCSAIVDGTFKDVNPGDAIRVSWPDYHLNERVFRVGRVDRGTLTDGRIRLDLVQDFFYVHRRNVQPGGPVTSFPTSGPPELDPG